METPDQKSSQAHMLKFVLQNGESTSIGPRLGQLSLPGKRVIHTPHYVATTSRGIVPHIAQDVMRKHTAIGSVYMGLEDFTEKSTYDNIPILRTPTAQDESALSVFSALQPDITTILGPRRMPPIHCPSHNTNSAVSILTSVGFQQLQLQDYITATQTLRPDIVVAMADLTSHENPGRKRLAKSADRTHGWLRDTLAAQQEAEKGQKTGVFGYVLPIEREQQSLYLQDLSQEYGKNLSGLAMADASSAAVLTPELSHLPRLLLRDIRLPHDIVDAVALGLDMVTFPLINESADGGLAFVFHFTDLAPSDTQAERPLAHDMWSAEYATNVSPLSSGCTCYTCTRHHRAYVHHLLQAREMLAWTLLQIHNHATMDAFFSAVRASIAAGTFENDAACFKRTFLPKMPVKTGLGPRVRGYQVKSVGGGEQAKNPKAYGRLDDAVQRMAESKSGVPIPTEDGRGLEQTGFADRVESS